MTLRRPGAKSNAKVFRGTDSFYARWRARAGAGAALREGDEASPPEQLLQAVWQHQRLRREHLRTLDGQPLKVLHPGFKNREAGPDFHDAVLQFGAESPRSGDVEVDLRSQNWRGHDHAPNPAYQRVLLHVVWDAGRPAATPLPTLALNGALDAPLHELHWWLGGDSADGFPEEFRGQCCAPLRDVPPTELTGLLHQSAQLRLEGKAAQLLARSRQAGWEQALWEGLFRALGYKQNVWPMQRLAELRPRWLTPRPAVPTLQARLLGLGGLLPAELTRAQDSADRHLRRLWDQWWRERDEFADCQLPRALWRFANLRPANHPQRRLALAAHWLAADDLPSKLERWIATELADRALEVSLREVLRVGEDEFWSWHWTMRSARLSAPQPLLGAQRVTDLAMNVALPWLWVRAVEGANDTLKQRVEHRYFAWPPGEDNARLRLARQRLLGGASGAALRGAAAQQGLLQVLRDFCDHSNAVCAECPFPELVKGWHAQRAPG